MKGGRHAPNTTKNAADPDRDCSGREKGNRLRQGVAAEIGASAYLAITVAEEGDGHAVGERDSNVTGDGAVESRYRLGDAALVESNMNAGATLLPLSGGAET